ncbi:hypothetical protein LguiA_031102 [Lonicera macranthoides]
MDQKRAKTRFTGSSFAGELAGDILSNIFLELPVISLLRCKCVCKLWRQLISDPIFIKLHLNQHHQEKILLRSDQDSFYSFNFEETCGNPVSFRDFPFKGRYLNRILGSCNGLLCLALNQELLDIILWNPSIGDYKMLPTANPPIDNRQMVGFGYDSSVDDYKIVRIITYESKFLRVDMYTLKTNLWEVISQDVLDRNSINVGSNLLGCALNKFIYWVGSGTIICFDLENNEFRKVSLPWDPNRGSPEYLMVIRGRLCIREAELPRHRNSSDDTVWTLKEDEQGKEWIKLMTIYWSSTSWPRRGPPGPVCCLENGKILLCREQCGDTSFKVRVYTITKKFPSYGPETSHKHATSTLHAICHYFDWFTYTESFVSPRI